jgi:hypothetical protein
MKLTMFEFLERMSSASLARPISAKSSGTSTYGKAKYSFQISFYVSSLSTFLPLPKFIYVFVITRAGSEREICLRSSETAGKAASNATVQRQTSAEN